MSLKVIRTNKYLNEILTKEHIEAIVNERMLVVLPAMASVLQIRKWFVEENNFVFGNPIITFNVFYKSILTKARRTIKRISRIDSIFIISDILEQQQEKLLFLKGVEDTFGFATYLQQLINFIKQEFITPEDVKKWSEKITDEYLKNKIHDLYLIYNEYERYLDAKGYYDTVDEGVLISDLIKENPELVKGIEKIILYGFFYMPQHQIRVLKALSKYVKDIKLYIFPPGDLDKFPLKRQDERLKMYFSLEYNDEFREPKTASDLLLMHLQNMNIGQTDFNKCKMQEQIKIFECPSQENEVLQIAKEIKRLITIEKVNPGDIAVIGRTTQDYINLFYSVFEQLDIPFHVFAREGLSLFNSQIGKFALQLIYTVMNDFERKAVIDLLNNRFLSRFFSTKDIVRIDRISRKYHVLSGIDDWDRVIKKLPDDTATKISNFMMLLQKINVKSASIRNFLQRVRDLFETLELNDIVSRSDKEFRAWERLFLLLDRLLENPLLRRRQVTIWEFYRFFSDILKGEHFTYTRDVINRVLISNLRAFASASRKIVFIFGLGDREFPPPYIPNPLLLPEEIDKLNKIIGSDIFLNEKAHYQQEFYLLLLALSAARERIYLSYSYLDSKMNEKLSSQYLEMIDEIIRNQNKATKYRMRMKPRDVLIPEPKNIWDEYELGRAIATVDIAHLKRLMTKYTVFEDALEGHKAEITRINTEFFTNYDGILTNKEILKGLSFGTIDNPASPVALEVFGACPFQFFANYILEIKALPEVELEIAPMDIGQIYHHLLNKIFKLVKKRYSKAGKIELDEKIFEKAFYEVYNKWITSKAVKKILKNPFVKYFFEQIKHPSKGLLGFLINEIRRLKEQDKLYLPEYFEWPFPPKGQPTLRLRNKEKSITAYFEGRVDRIDIYGDLVSVVDYKYSTLSGLRFFDFKNLQLPLYLYAASIYLNKYPDNGYYLSLLIPNRVVAGGNKRSDDLNNALNLALEYVVYIQKGLFPPFPEFKQNVETKVYVKSNWSCKSCPFNTACRIKITGMSLKTNIFVSDEGGDIDE